MKYTTYTVYKNLHVIYKLTTSKKWNFSMLGGNLVRSLSPSSNAFRHPTNNSINTLLMIKNILNGIEYYHDN